MIGYCNKICISFKNCIVLTESRWRAFLFVCTLLYTTFIGATVILLCWSKNALYTVYYMYILFHMLFILLRSALKLKFMAYNEVSFTSRLVYT